MTINTRDMTEKENAFIKNLSVGTKDRAGMIGTFKGSFPYENQFIQIFEPFCDALNTDSFRKDATNVIKAFKERGGFLSSHTAYEAFTNEGKAVRVDTKYYTYLWILNPTERQCVNCYCFIRSYLEESLDSITS